MRKFTLRCPKCNEFPTLVALQFNSDITVIWTCHECQLTGRNHILWSDVIDTKPN